MAKSFIYSISILFFMFFFKYLMFPNYKDKGIYLEYKSYKKYIIHAYWNGGCELLEMALTGEGYYGKLGGDGMVSPMDDEENSSCSEKYVIYKNNYGDFVLYSNKAALELEIGKYKAKKAEDVIKSIKRRYSIE